MFANQTPKQTSDKLNKLIKGFWNQTQSSLETEATSYGTGREKVK